MNRLAEELVRITEQRASAVLATVVEVQDNGWVEPGEKWLICDGTIKLGTIPHEKLLQAVLKEADARLREERSKLVALEIPAVGGKVEVFFEVMSSPPRLIVVGAGHIAVPLAKFAKGLDFHVTVIDDRLLFANRDTSSTYIVLVTRGHKYDEPCLREIIHGPAKYIGMIGSRRRVKACFQRFRDEEKISEEVLQRVYAPIGLDINTETPEEISLSILAEIVKVRRGGKARSLSGH